MNKAKQIPQELLDELKSCINRFKNIDTENMHIKELNEKLVFLYSAFSKVLDARNETHDDALGLSELSVIREIQAALIKPVKDSVEIGDTCSPDPETERILDEASNLMDEIVKKYSNQSN